MKIGWIALILSLIFGIRALSNNKSDPLTESKDNAIQALQIEMQSLCVGCEVQLKDVQFFGLEKATPTSKVEVASLGRLLRGSFSVEGKVRGADSAELGRIWMSGQIRIFKNVPVTTKFVPNGYTLAKGDYVFQKRDVTFVNDEAASEMEIMQGSLGRGLREGDVILKRYIAREKGVSFGEIVKASVKSANWSISMNAQARQSGFIGDTIRIYNTDSRKELLGKIVSKGVVEVQ